MPDYWDWHISSLALALYFSALFESKGKWGMLLFCLPNKIPCRYLFLSCHSGLIQSLVVIPTFPILAEALFLGFIFYFPYRKKLESQKKNGCRGIVLHFLHFLVNEFVSVAYGQTLFGFFRFSYCFHSLRGFQLPAVMMKTVIPKRINHHHWRLLLSGSSLFYFLTRALIQRLNRKRSAASLQVLLF